MKLTDRQKVTIAFHHAARMNQIWTQLGRSNNSPEREAFLSTQYEYSESQMLETLRELEKRHLAPVESTD